MEGRAQKRHSRLRTHTKSVWTHSQSHAMSATSYHEPCIVADRQSGLSLTCRSLPPCRCAPGAESWPRQCIKHSSPRPQPWAQSCPTSVSEPAYPPGATVQSESFTFRGCWCCSCDCRRRCDCRCCRGLAHVQGDVAAPTGVGKAADVVNCGVRLSQVPRVHSTS